MKLFIKDDFYADFNKAMSGAKPMTPEYAAMKDLLVSACSKLPKYKGKVFRGAGLEESAFAKTLTKNQKFTFNGRFTSSSLDDFTADLFRRGDSGI